MKILILSAYPAPYRVEIFKELARIYDTDSFFERNYDVERNDKWFIKSDDTYSFRILDNHKNIKAYRKAVSKLRQYDLVLCYEPFTKQGRQIQRRCMRSHIPYMINVDGADKIRTSFPYKQVKSFYIKRAAVCFAGCQKAVRYLKAYGAKDKQIALYSFTSLKKADILAEPCPSQMKEALREERHIIKKFTFIAVGRFIKSKGFDILLSSWKAVENVAQLYLIGGGSSRAEYENIVRQNALHNVYILDYMPFEELKKYYLCADCFVMPTRSEVWGLVINEAMACGLPVICSDQCTAGNELITNGRNGYLYECENADELAMLLKKMTELSARSLYEMSCESLKTIQYYCYETVIEIHKREIDRIRK